MDERRLRFFLTLQKKVEESKSLSNKAKDKFYALAEDSIGDHLIVKYLGGEGVDLAKTYKQNGFVPIDLGELEVSITDKKRKPLEARFDLNKHKPLDVTSFLTLFRSDDHPFKYLIHDLTKPGEVFNLNNLIEDVSDKFKVETKKYLIPKSLYSRFEAFIGLSRKSWYFKGDSINFSFHLEKVKKWCSENPSKHPLLNFGTEIRSFKESIRIEANLKEIVEFVLAKKGLLTTFDIHYENVDNANFYTDVDALTSGLAIVFNSFNQRIQNGNEIKIVFEAKRLPTARMRILKIIHIGSKCTKELKESDLFGGDLKHAKKYFYQLCDWSIIAKNLNPDINKINILYHPSTGKKPREKTEDPIEGFTHVLTFYS